MYCLPRPSLLLRPQLTSHLHYFRWSPAALRALCCDWAWCQPALRLLTKEVLQVQQDLRCLEDQLSLDQPLNSLLRSAQAWAVLWTHNAETGTVRKDTVSNDWHSWNTSFAADNQALQRKFSISYSCKQGNAVTAAFISVLVHGIICIRIL